MTTDMARRAREQAIEDRLRMAFLPLHKRRFGIACGVACGTLLALLTVMGVLRAGVAEAQADGTFNLWLLRAYFAGYTVTWPGVLVGFAWGFVVGAVGGWFTAFVRNFMLAVQAFLLRTRVELSRTRDFLDHI